MKGVAYKYAATSSKAVVKEQNTAEMKASSVFLAVQLFVGHASVSLRRRYKEINS